MYRVMVDDNFGYMDEDKRWELGSFATAEKALTACRGLVEKNLADYFKSGMAAAELYEIYVQFGDDPFIVGTPGEPKVTFSAWNYAKRRAEEICSGANS
ncbi:MAG: hypothetical protein ACLPID_03680 [Beijerinckiaceae bacterium]